MSLKLGWLAIRNVEAATLVPALQRTKESVRVEYRPSGFRVVDAPVSRPSMIDSLLGRPALAPFVSAMLIGATFDAAPVWAEALSEELGAVAISFVVLEGTWSYILYDRGERVLSMSLEKLPTLSGDVTKAAALLGVEVELFERYRSEIALARACPQIRTEPGEERGKPGETRGESLLAQVTDEQRSLGFRGRVGRRENLRTDPSKLSHENTVAGVYERLRPLRGDEHHPSAEWGHLDFARRLGRITYPEPGTGTEVDWSRPLPTLSRHDVEAALNVGDEVVHSALGIGQVVSFETLDGRPMVEVQFSDGRGMKMSRATLRPLMSEADLKATFDALRASTPEAEADAERSARHVQLVKIGTGPALAEVVRDLVRQATTTALSADEKRLLENARSHLVNEIARIRKTSPDDVRAELTEACRLT